MRVENHIHIREIRLYHYEKWWKAAHSFHDLNELFSEGTIIQRQCQEWFARFKLDNTSLEDNPGRGRPSNFDNQALLAIVKEDESLTTRMLAENLNVDHSTIVRRLKKLWKLTGWVPHELSDKNNVDRVRIFSELLQRNEQSIANKGWGLLPHPPYSPTEAPTASTLIARWKTGRWIKFTTIWMT